MNKEWLDIDGLIIEFTCDYGEKDEAVGIMSDYHTFNILHIWLDHDAILELDILPILSTKQLTTIEEVIDNHLNTIKSN